MKYTWLPFLLLPLVGIPFDLQIMCTLFKLCSLELTLGKQILVSEHLGVSPQLFNDFSDEGQGYLT